MIDIRYYMGKLKCKIVAKSKKKALVEWLEVGVIGNTTEGHKRTLIGFRDIVPIRMCWRKRK